MEGAPDKKASDRLFPPQNVKVVVGFCPKIDEVKSTENLEIILKNAGLTPEQFKSVLEYLNRTGESIAIGAVMGVVSYNFSNIPVGGAIWKSVELALNYLRGRFGKKLLDEDESSKPVEQKSPSSGAFRLQAKAAETVDKSRRLCDLGFSRDEIIGGVMALGAIDTAPTMVNAFWEKSLAELETEAGNTFGTLLRFLEKGGKSVSEIGSVEVAVRTEVQTTVTRSDLPPVTPLQIETARENDRAEEAMRAMNAAINSNSLVAAVDTPATPLPRLEGDAARDVVPGGGITDTKRVSLAGDTQPVSARDFLAHLEQERKAKEQSGNAS